MDLQSVIVEIYESKKTSISEERVFDLLTVIQRAILSGSISSDVRIKLLAKLATKCKSSQQQTYLKRTANETQGGEITAALEKLIKQRKVSSRDLLPDPSTSAPARSSPVPILVKPEPSRMHIRLKSPKPIYHKGATPYQSDASDVESNSARSDQDSARISGRSDQSDELTDLAQKMTNAIQNYVKATVKKTIDNA
jgi:hypothetical protein